MEPTGPKSYPELDESSPHQTLPELDESSPHQNPVLS